MGNPGQAVVAMRISAFALIAFASISLLRADEVLQNGDFTDGSNHWRGDGRTPADYAQDNPSAATNPLTSKGLIVQLKPDRWTKVAQDFKGNNDTHYCLTVTYKYAPDLAFSTKAEDYTNIPAKVGFEGSESWTPFNIPVGQFFVTVDDIDDTKGYYEKVASKAGTSETQTYQDPGLPMTPLSDKMVTVSFPPGTGTVVILKISVTSSP
jgi:hypothetical protein